MTRDQLIAAFKKYDERLVRFDVKRAAMNHEPASIASLDHCRWMCREALKFVDPTVEGGNPVVLPQHMEKAMRWVGFIQGVLWAHGIYTIDEMKDDNR